MKKRLLVLFIVLIFFSFILFEIFKSSYARDDNTYTRKQLQDMVVSTALSYYYKKGYSDYDAGQMDLSGFRWRNLNIIPEDVSNSNYYMVDCSAFAYLVYNGSLGYNMANEMLSENKHVYQLEPSVWDRKYYKNFEAISPANSIESFRIGAEQFGIGWYTRFLSTAAKEYWSNKETGFSSGVEYYDVNNNTPFVYYYQFPQEFKNKTNEEISETNNYNSLFIFNNDETNLLSILQPGDIVVASRKKKSDDSAIGGHTMIYIGEEYAKKIFGNDTNVTVIHSSTPGGGGNYDSYTIPVTLGNGYSITTGDNTLLTNHFLYNNPYHSSEYTDEVVVIRPINSFCANDNSCKVTTMNMNALARKELFYLKSEQYGEINFKYNNYINDEETTIDRYISKHNSINVGDILKYNLKLTNKSLDETNDYENLSIVGIIPEGTEYVSCNKKCIYNSSYNTVTWNNVTIPANNSEVTYYYNVKALNEGSIQNDGIKIITQNNNILQFGQLENEVQPTLNNVNINIFNKKIEKFKEKVDSKKVTFSLEDTNDYKKNYESSDNLQLSSLDFIKSLYYNNLNIDLGYLNSDTIKDAIFKYDFNKKVYNSSKGYAIRTNIQETDGEYYKDLTSEEKKIYDMLVPGMYGGRNLIGDELNNRVRHIKIPHDFEYGDIIITYCETEVSRCTIDRHSNDLGMKAYIYLGRNGSNAIVASYDENSLITKSGDNYNYSYDDNNGYGYLKIYDNNAIYDEYKYLDDSNEFISDGKTGNRILKEIYSKDLFVVFRPTRVYGTTVKYEYNDEDNTQNNLFVAYGTYKNLATPTRDGYIFDGWYSDNLFTNKVTENSALVSNETHTLYAKWIENSLQVTFSDDLVVNDEISAVGKISAGTTYLELRNKIATNGNILFKNKDNQELVDNSIIKTGDKLVVSLDNQELVYTLLVYGDVTGDGVVDILDAREITKYIVGNSNIGDINILAGDLKYDDLIKMNDVMKIIKSINN